MIPLISLFMCTLSAQNQDGVAIDISSPSLVYQINPKSLKQTLPQFQWILEEGEKKLSPEELLQGNTKDAKLIQVQESPLIDIEAHKAYWLNIKLSSNDDLDSLGLVLGQNGNGWIWEFTFKNVEAHIYKYGKKIRTGLSGSAIPYSLRDYPEKLDPSVVWLNFQEGDTLNVWIKLVMAETVKSSIEVSLQNQFLIKQPQPASLRVNIGNFLHGAGLVLLVLALALFFWFRNPIYLWFTIYQLFIFLQYIIFEFNNETYLFLVKENPRILILGSTFISTLSLLSLFQLGRVYIGTKVNFPKIDQTIIIISLILILATITGIYFRINYSTYSEYWFLIRAGVMGSIFISISMVQLYLLLSKNKFARVFSLGILLFFSFTLLRLIIINVTDTPGTHSNTTLFNSLFIIFTTTAIIAYRFVLITQEKEKANQEKLKSDLEKLKQIQLTQQKTEEAKRLEELEKIKSNFFSNMTHEFRTPLTLIIEPLRQVIEEPGDTWMEKVKLAKNNSHKLLQITNQLLDISKLESQQMSLDLNKGQILNIIQPLVDSFTLLAKEKGIQFSFEKTEDIKAFDFDAVKMEKVISNLMSNAIKFTPTGGKINIRIHEEEHHGNPFFTFKIKDSGIGIPKDEQTHIFDRFYQVDGSNTRRHQGTGIGLSLTKELLELMGGSISVESKEGEGSTFMFEVPMHSESIDNIVLEPESIPRDLKETTVQLLDNKSINLEADNIALVIEDNEELRQFIIASISSKYQVIEAANGREGLEKALEYIPDIIISDIMMPEMNGFEVCEKVKTNEKTAHIPIILLTAKTAMDSRIQGLEFGADAYMNKPFNTKELLIRMKNLIDVRLLLQQKFSQEIEMGIKGNQLTDPVISEYDKQFLERIKKYIEKNLEVEELSIEQIAKAMGMSRTQLFRKIKALLNQSPSTFLRNIRLKTAKQLLLEKKGNVSEIAYQVGFSSPKYFSTKFKEKYGISPGEV